MELEGRVALITGVSRGIGQGIARSLAEAGADIVVNYQQNKEGAERTVAEVEAFGRRALSYQADVRTSTKSRRWSTRLSRPLARWIS